MSLIVLSFGSFKQGNLLYSLNEKQNTAEIKGCAVKSANKIIIPKSIPNLKAEYTITGINEYAFKFCKIQSVEFVENSKIQSISSYNSPNKLQHNRFHKYSILLLLHYKLMCKIKRVVNRILNRRMMTPKLIIKIHYM